MGPHFRRACLAMALAIVAVDASGLPNTYAGCPLFPGDNYWNTRIDTLPVHPSSSAWVASVGNATRLHPDFSNALSDGFGFTPVAVQSNQPGVPIFFTNGAAQAQGDPGPYPIPPSLATPGGDREVVVLDATNCILFELYGQPNGTGGWIASGAARYDLRSHALRPAGHQSLDQAGLPVLQGLLRWEDVLGGTITHAIRFTASNAWGMENGAMKYLWPARHGSGTSSDPSFPPMGARFRLKAGFDISGFDARTQIVLRALKEFGMVLASRGGNWFLQGVSDSGWPDAVIDELRSITGAAFEVVDTAPLLIDVNSGQARQVVAPPPPPPPPPPGPVGGPEDGFPPGGMPEGWVQARDSSAPWVVANDAANGGSLSLKSGAVNAGQRSEVSYGGIFAAGTVAFARKVAGSSGTLEFLVDGRVQGSWTGDQEWATFRYALPPGTHTVSWRYVKTSASTSDAAWVDSVTLPAIAPCRFRTLGGRCLTE